VLAPEDRDQMRCLDACSICGRQGFPPLRSSTSRKTKPRVARSSRTTGMTRPPSTRLKETKMRNGSGSLMARASLTQRRAEPQGLHALGGPHDRFLDPSTFAASGAIIS
jgi:hypothetical protein